jgi:RHS repeat-associated protein
MAGTATTAVSYAVNSLNQYTNANVTLRYDANGNLTNDTVWSYSYDAENRLTAASTNGLSLTYTYDVLGRLNRRNNGTTGAVTRYYYAGWQLITEVQQGGGGAKYVVGPGLDEPIRMTRGGTNYYYHADGLGSVTEVTTNGGFVVEQYTYDVYGAPTIKNGSGNTLTNSAINNRLMFTARDRDPDTGLYNYRYRYYSPTLGRFVQPDPIRTGGGINMYSYVANKPTQWTDPYGLEVWIEGPSGTEPPLHRSINVGDPFGQYYSQSYGAVFPDPFYGRIYEDVERGGPIVKYLKTTPQQDAEIAKALRNELEADPGGFYGPETCISYSKAKFEEIKKKHNLTETKPPARKPAPRAWFRQPISSTTSVSSGSTYTSTRVTTTAGGSAAPLPSEVP